jgi:NADPH-dependent curcumin reductase CurA
MPGVTAWYGTVKIIEAQAGKTVVVSAASGAVGSAVGALAKQRGAARSASRAAPTSAAT